jgi:hypothetical protein
MGDIFDKKLISKFLLFYSPARSHEKIAYDSINQHDGELLNNSGIMMGEYLPHKMVFSSGGAGPLNSLIPLLDFIAGIKKKQHGEEALNQFLYLVLSAVNNTALMQG